MMDEKSDIDLPEEPNPRKGASSTGGLIILSLILVVCVVVAYFLSNMVTKPPPVTEIVNAGEEASETETPEAAGPDEPGEPAEPAEPAELPREGIEALTMQLRGLASTVEAINSWRETTGRYPLSLDELVEGTDYVLPENPYNPGNPVSIVHPGDFSPGGIGYHRYISIDGSGGQGFILFAYADSAENGVTLEDPAEMILPAVFDPPIEVPLRAVIAAMDEGGNNLDVGRLSEQQE